MRIDAAAILPLQQVKIIFPCIALYIKAAPETVQFPTLDKIMQIAPMQTGFRQLCGRNDAIGGRLHYFFYFAHVVHAITSLDIHTLYYTEIMCVRQQ